jgi:cyclopropane fatty-acyl-phospholipid synthase-like methyltransferase
MTRLSDLVTFADRSLAKRYGTRPMPMATLIAAYLDGRADIPDMDALLDARRELFTFSLTAAHLKFLLGRMAAEWLIHSRQQDRRIVRDHYDRGDDFFGAFLGETMVYSCAFFGDPGESVEQGQRNKMDRICRKLRVRSGDELLDVGCGWGTLALHSAKHFGARATGVTLAAKGAAFGNARIAREGLEARARIECLDYRNLPPRKYDRIVSIEMVEHAGVKNLRPYFDVIRDRLKDDGLLLIQWCAVRGPCADGAPPVGMRPEDMIWGLFMNENIFPGADASVPLSKMVRIMEKAGLEIHSVENLSVHYVLTLKKWHENWQRNRDAVLRSYGERWYRLWHLFLGWSWRIGLQGTSVCYQILAHKNLDTFDRRSFLKEAHLSRPSVDSSMAAE